MPPKKNSKKKETNSVMKELEKFDKEDYIPQSAAFTSIVDSLDQQIFDLIPEGLTKEDEFVLGIDEAGRGPVLGPMVYTAAFCKLERHQDVRDKIGANDSKQLKEIERERMLKSIEKSEWVGYTGVVLTPAYLSKNMMRRMKYNLNAMSHDTAKAMIRRAINHHKINVKEVYVDTVGKAEKYQASLLEDFPRLHICVESKADATYPIVGAASIVAKVARDKLIHSWTHLEDNIDVDIETGSGYPGDPKTKNWLRQNIHPLFGLPSFARLSWQTAQDIIDKSCLKVTWEDAEDEDDSQKKMKKAGSKRSIDDEQPSKSRKSAFFREHKLKRVNLESYLVAF